MKHIIVLIAITIIPCLCFSNTKNNKQAKSANKFLNSIGVNSSLNKRGKSLEKTIECPQYWGIRWLRSGYENGTTIYIYKRLRDESGVKFIYGLGNGGNDIVRLLEGVRDTAALNALLAIEGNNEPNNWGIEYQREKRSKTNSWIALAKLQRDLYKAVKNNPILKRYPVFGISENGGMIDNTGLQFLTIPTGASSLMPDGIRYADYVNTHNYVSHPSWDNGTLHDNPWISSSPFSDCRVDEPYGNHGLTWYKKHKGYEESELDTLSKVTTETGLTIDKNISEEQYVRILLNLYLAQFKRKWNYTAVYLLRDRTDEEGNQKFGFNAPGYVPRKSATYLHNLTTIPNDTNTPARLGKSGYTFYNSSETTHDLLLQKSDRTFYLIFWKEKYLERFDIVTVEFDRQYESIKIYDPTVSPNIKEYLISRNTHSLTLTDHPIIIKIGKENPSEIKKETIDSSSENILYPRSSFSETLES